MSTTTSPTTAAYESFDARMDRIAKLQEELVLAQKKTERQIKETNRQLARHGDRVGELVSAMAEGGLLRIFKKQGYKFDVGNPRRKFGSDETGYGEVDLLLENGEYVLLVEVKTNLSTTHIKKHLERIKKFRAWIDRHGDRRRLLAAVGGGLVSQDVSAFALKKGMFVVQQSGENVKVIPPEGEPTIW